ncbi:transcriptional regulator, BadM/Rrf2 family [Cohaesibacter sp. ES.047]|uniref:RrF2 family transcriptional regulator n=1 Tax=Cohaesibacter sp. ES.047 TaxID=1798205 RepID=UPI000BB91C05|nr:Rrf2 family transcriptional regulator [Cohaesibacter sp. ES.047]SNY92736.1 transcriptional regulator, BadM/Rrf2 family [Cohaesibacter sp. ES.047]
MRLTQHSNYAMRLLMYCALKPDQPIRLAEIADAYDISGHHLNKIAQRLAHVGVIHAIRGRNGGIRLAKNPADINVGQILRQTEENLTIVECFSEETNTCPLINECRFRVLLQDALAAFLKVLDAHTLEDLIAHPECLKPLLGLNTQLSDLTKIHQPQCS